MKLTATYKTKSKTVQLPATWDELYPFISKSRDLRNKISASILSLNESMIRLCVAVHFVKQTGWMRHVQGHYIDHIVRNLDIRFDNLIPVHLVPGFSFFARRYTMVAPNMEDASIREFIFADEYLQKYISGDTSAIFHLTALLCRQDTKSRIRQRQELDQEAAFIQRYAGSILFGNQIGAAMASALMLILHTKQYLKSVYFPILGGEQPASNKIDFGFHNIVMDIAENGAFGDIEKVYDTPLHDLFVYLIKKKQDHDRSQIPQPQS